MIKVQLLGGASLRSGDVPLAGPPAQRHRIALLSLIVAAWPQPLSRDRAMALLWPDRDLPKARRLLNLAVHVLRSTLGEHAIISTSDGLLLDPANLTCDLHELRDAVAANDAERIVRCYTGALLEGFHLGESVEFGFWLEQHRNELDHAYTGALRMVAEGQEREGDVHGRVRTIRRLVAARPDSAVYARALMRALDAAGDRAGAIRHATEYAGRLRADLDLEPDADVMALAEQLRSAAPAHRPAGSQRRHDQAYHLYLQGRRWLSDSTLTSVARAIDCFEHALAHDSTFAPASASLAIAFIDLAEQLWTEPEEAYRRAAAAAANALKHDVNLGEAHAAIGHLKAVRNRDWAGAERELKRALELDPDDANAHDLYGRLCLGLGRIDEALALHRRAQELDPLSHRLEVVSTLLRAGRHHEAMVGARDAVELDPNHDRSRAMLGWACFLSGRREDGLAELERAVKLAPGASVWLGQLGQAYGMAGEREKAHEILEELETRAERGYMPPHHLAYVYAGLGDHGGAVECLGRAVAERSAAIYAIRGSFLFTSLHGLPAYEALL